MLRPQSQDRRGREPLRHRADVELARDSERLSVCGEYAFSITTVVSLAPALTPENHYRLRPRDGIEPRRALGKPYAPREKAVASRRDDFSLASTFPVHPFAGD